MCIKTLVKSENSAMMYLKQKAFSKFYRARDFVFLRHAFTSNGNAYMIDKSIEDINYPPFTTIVRGNLCILWGIIDENDKRMIIADAFIKNEGYLNESQNANIMLKFFKGFKNINSVLEKSRINLEGYSLFH